MKTLTKSGELVKRLLAEYPTAGSLTLARRLFKEHPQYFNSVEQARHLIRYHRGVEGTKNRSKMTDLTHVKDIQKVLEDRFNIPEPAVLSRPPYMLPKFNDTILIFGDLHYPYQDNRAIYSAIEYGIKKEINTIILNGDCIDCYHISRFPKDSRKPTIEYEAELFYDFLINLRQTFPNALIVWKFGNHEERWDRYLKDNAPVLYMVATENLEDYIPVNELDIIVVKDQRRIIAGDLSIIHGHEYHVGVGGVNPARSMFLKARANCLVNHFHRSSSHKGNDINGKKIRTYSLGAMCAIQDYSPYGDQDCSFGYLRIVNGVTFVNNREL